VEEEEERQSLSLARRTNPAHTLFNGITGLGTSCLGLSCRAIATLSCHPPSSFFPPWDGLLLLQEYSQHVNGVCTICRYGAISKYSFHGERSAHFMEVCI
jgi:hypothetical protein